MPSSNPPDPLAAAVRRHDPDRYLASLFAPAAAQPALFALYAFNHELARAHEVTREPGLALIRLQWWREVVDGSRRQHEVAGPLAALIAAGRLPQPLLLDMIEAREADAEAAADLPALLDRLAQGPGALAQAAGAALGAAPAELGRLRTLGAGIGLAGLLRNVPALARHGRCLLPPAMLAAHGLTADAIASPAPADWTGLRADLAASARTLLGPPRRWQAGLAAALPAVLARRDLRPDGRGLAGRAPMALSALLGLA